MNWDQCNSWIQIQSQVRNVNCPYLLLRLRCVHLSSLEGRYRT